MQQNIRLVHLAKGSARGRIAGTLATMMAVFRSSPANVRLRILENEVSVDGECKADAASTVLKIAKIPVLHRLSVLNRALEQLITDSHGAESHKPAQGVLALLSDSKVLEHD